MSDLAARLRAKLPTANERELVWCSVQGSELREAVESLESLSAQVVQLRGALVELVLLDGLRRRAPGVVESEHDIRWPAAWAAARAALVEQSK